MDYVPIKKAENNNLEQSEMDFDDTNNNSDDCMSIAGSVANSL